jgi:hypothetical protein
MKQIPLLWTRAVATLRRHMMPSLLSMLFGADTALTSQPAAEDCASLVFCKCIRLVALPLASNFIA